MTKFYRSFGIKFAAVVGFLAMVMAVLFGVTGPDGPILACDVAWLDGFTGHAVLASGAAAATVPDDVRKAIETQIDAIKARLGIKEKPADPPVSSDGAVGIPVEQVQVMLNDTAKLAAEAAVKAYREAPTVEAEYNAPNIITDISHWKYDNVKAADIDFMIELLNCASSLGIKANRPATEAAYKALAHRIHSNEVKETPHLVLAAKAFRDATKGAIKANEIAHSTLATAGDEWIGVAYSSDLWEAIRQEVFLVQKMPTFEFPDGVESLVIPIEGADPTWYNVAQATAMSNATTGIATNTVTASKMGTDKRTMTLGKLGARTLFAGELTEDSVLPYVAQLRSQIQVSGAEYLEAAILDGDTDTTATTNINHIGGTPDATDWFTVFNGLRKLAIITNTANKRDGGTLAAADFLATLKLMGTNGKNALGHQKRIEFILDNSTFWKALELDEVKTRDVFSNPTLENGYLGNLWGYVVRPSGQICRAGNGLSNSDGKVDQTTTSNNTKGTLLAVRYDQCRIGFRRRMALETTRIAAADATEIVALMRLGFQTRDNEAVALSYNLTV